MSLVLGGTKGQRELAVDPEASLILLSELPLAPLARAGGTQCLGHRPTSEAKRNSPLGFLPCASTLLGSKGDWQAEGLRSAWAPAHQKGVLLVPKGQLGVTLRLRPGLSQNGRVYLGRVKAEGEGQSPA